MILIDGEQLAEYMIDFGVGVTPRQARSKSNALTATTSTGTEAVVGYYARAGLLSGGGGLVGTTGGIAIATMPRDITPHNRAMLNRIEVMGYRVGIGEQAGQ